jgi:hypothetical protein
MVARKPRASQSLPRRISRLALGWLLSSCASLTPVYPARPAASPGEPIADPTPARVVVHATIAKTALESALDRELPATGEGVVALMGRDRAYTWQRAPLVVRFEQGRIRVDVHVLVSVDLPVSNMQFPLDLRVLAEPVVSHTYQARLQSMQVSVSSTDTRMKFANLAAGALDKVQATLEQKLVDFAYDLRPALRELYQRIDRPIMLPLGEANGCADLQVLGVEAGPTVLADGIEKDLALIVAPSITLPCTASEQSSDLPPLANVSTLQGGPFSVLVPIAARYEELARAMALTFTEGKLFFSKEYPALYLEKPEVYAAHDQLVLKLHLAGPVHKFGFDTSIDGDIFFAGHPVVEDNELRVPDLEPTIDTKSLLLKLKAAVDGDAIRDEARAALRLDIGERMRSVRDKLSKDLEFGDGLGCLKADAGKVEVTGVHAHGS